MLRSKALVSKAYANDCMYDSPCTEMHSEDSSEAWTRTGRSAMAISSAHTQKNATQSNPKHALASPALASPLLLSF